VFLLAGTVAGCATEVDDAAPEGVQQNELALEERHSYLRCNSTSWNLDDRSRFSVADAYGSKLLFRVTEDWMVSGGDTCVITWSNALNGWGTQSGDMGLNAQTSPVSTDPFTIPAGGAASAIITSDITQTATNSFTFRVKFPAKGAYVAYYARGSLNISVDVGSNWEPVPQASTAKVSSIGLARGYGEMSSFGYVGYSNGELYRTFNAKDATPTWQRVDLWTDASGGKHQLPPRQITSIGVNPLNYRDAVVGYTESRYYAKLARTANGYTWTDLTSYPLSEVWGVSFSPLSQNTLYVPGRGGVAQSRDAGQTWTVGQIAGDPLAAPLASGDAVSSVAIVGHDADHLIVGTAQGKLFETLNASSASPSFVSIADPAMPARMITAVTVDPINDEATTVYVTYAGANNDSVWRFVRRGDSSNWANVHSANLPTTPIPVPSVYAFTGVSVNPKDHYSMLYLSSVGAYGTAKSHPGWGATWWDFN
jgi:hypothetical protein